MKLNIYNRRTRMKIYFINHDENDLPYVTSCENPKENKSSYTIAPKTYVRIDRCFDSAEEAISDYLTRTSHNFKQAVYYSRLYAKRLKHLGIDVVKLANSQPEGDV
jgi:hypothetical protein